MTLNVMLLLFTGLEVNASATDKMTACTWINRHSISILEMSHVYCVCGGFHFFDGLIITAYPITSDSHACSKVEEAGILPLDSLLTDG